MYYSIGEVSKMFNLSVPTLRYYDSEGLFGEIERVNGVRRFSDKDISTLQVIECLKLSKMEIKDIKAFMDLVKEGPKSYEARLELFENKRKFVEEEIKKLTQTLAFLKYKCWYYQTAIIDGSEENINKMLPNNLPEGIQELYNSGHKKIPN